MSSNNLPATLARPVVAIGLAAAATLFASSPALAQADSSGEKINQLIVFGNDPCPQSTSSGEITVCARKDEGERYRIPEPLRGIDTPANRAWTDRVLAYETVGNFGTQSCSPVGAGGWTGCSQQLIHNAYAEKKESSPDIKFGELIAAERAKRLSTIDEDARATQTRVEAAEREYEARQGSAAVPNASDAASTASQSPDSK